MVAVPANAAAGSVITIVLLAVQPILSVTVTVYVPAVRLEAVAAVPAPRVQLYVYGAVPPLATIVALPVAVPLHATFNCDCVSIVIVGHTYSSFQVNASIHTYVKGSVVLISSSSITFVLLLAPPNVVRSIGVNPLFVAVDLIKPVDAVAVKTVAPPNLPVMVTVPELYCSAL